MKRPSTVFSLLAASIVWLGMSGSAWACPMCKLANESDSRLPKAYMYSILFMLAMPATLGTTFGIGFYRLSRKAKQMQEEVNRLALNAQQELPVAGSYKVDFEPPRF